MKKRLNMAWAVLSALALALTFLVTACGDDEPTAVKAPGAQATPTAQAPATQAPKTVAATPTTSSAASLGDLDPEKECRIDSYCERKCAGECRAEERDRTAYFAAKKAKTASSPFEVKIDRVYMAGSCHKGDTPEKRKDASGVRAIVEGTMTYTGDDLLYDAEMQGSAYLRFGSERFAEVSAQGKSYGGYYGRSKIVSTFTRSVRGADPWFKGESRPFHWESHPLSEVFCETTPDEAAVYIELATRGVKNGRVDYPVAFVPLNWEEVIGMALRQQISLIKKVKKDIVLEPADAHYAKLDRILITQLTGKTLWIKRSSAVQNGEISKGPAAVFPVESSSEEWKVSVTGISQAKEFGGYAHKGDDQFLAIVDLKFTYTGEETGSLSKLSARLETIPGKWAKPVSKAMGQLDTEMDIDSGTSVSGKIVFPKQRFERPFRLEIKTPDKETMYLDVLSYDIGPERLK